MEKSADPMILNSRSRRSYRILRTAAAILFCLLAYFYLPVPRFLALSSTQLASSATNIKHTSWGEIEPKKSIEWHPCYDNFRCARVEVPLDWNNKSDPRTAAVAVIKLPAKVSVTDARYGGSVLLNPGGPGGSGVRLALERASKMQNIIDASRSPPSIASGNSSGLYFEMIGFDPRGVNNTTPSANCFPSDLTRQNYDIAKQAQGIIQDSSMFTRVYNGVQGISGTCSHVMSHEGEHTLDVGHFMTTPLVVEDMVELTERLAEWREKEAKMLLKGSCKKMAQAVLERVKWHKGKEMVQYFGFSYGTVLGATMASMHPKRMKRVVIDGVADSDDYYAGTWLSNLQDTDTIMTRFFEECHEVGPHKCAIYSATGAHGSRAILEQVLGGLRYAPIPVVATESLAPDLITYSDLMALIRDALYRPRAEFKNLAQAVFELSVGNGTLLAKRKQEARVTSCPTSQCRKEGPWSKACHTGGVNIFAGEVSALIHCTDAPDWTGTDQNFHREKWTTLKKQSTWLGDYWSEITMYCANLSIRPAWRFKGESKQKVGGNTSYPILLMTNSRDPVTPLRNAHKISARFNGSIVLEQDDEGHCAAAEPSMCVAKHLREYFQTGKLPKKGTICKQDWSHFDERPDDGVVALMNDDDKHLLKMVLELGAVKRERGAWLGI